MKKEANIERNRSSQTCRQRHRNIRAMSADGESVRKLEIEKG